MRSGSEALLNQFADRGVLAHDLRNELDRRLDIESRLRQGLGRHQPLGTDPRLRGSQGQIAHDAHVVHMRHQVHGRRKRQVLVTELALTRAQTRERHAMRLPVAGPARRPGTQTAAKFRFRASGMFAPVGIILRLHDAAPVDRHQAAQVRMHAGTMQALVVILPQDLPVALHGPILRMPNAQARQRPVLQRRRISVEIVLGILRRSGAQVHEDKAVPLTQLHRVKRQVLVDGGNLPAVHWATQELSVQAVAEGVVAAGDCGRRELARLGRAQGRSAMTAGVVEGPQHSRVVAHQQDCLRAQPEGSERARSRQRLRSTQVDPVAVPDLLQLELEVRRVQIVGAGQRRLRPAQAIPLLEVRVHAVSAHKCRVAVIPMVRGLKV